MGWLPEYDRSWLRPDIIAGALLVVLTDSMIREAIEHGGKETGLLLVIGFGRSSGSVAAATGVGNG